MNDDRDTLKPSQSEKRPHRDDDDESHAKHDWPKATVDADTARRATKRVAEAPTVKAADAHATSNKSTVEAVMAALERHAAYIAEQTKSIKASTFSGFVKEAFDRVHASTREIGVYLGQAGVEKADHAQLHPSLDAIESAYVKFAEAIEKAREKLPVPATVIPDQVHLLIDAMHRRLDNKKVSGRTPTTAAAPTVIALDVNENLEAARDAAQSVLAGNKKDLMRLDGHLQHLNRELPFITKNDAYDRVTVPLVRIVRSLLDQLDKAGHGAGDQSHEWIVGKFRETK